jgi:hypothetical protein
MGNKTRSSFPVNPQDNNFEWKFPKTGAPAEDSGVLV